VSKVVCSGLERYDIKRWTISAEVFRLVRDQDNESVEERIDLRKVTEVR